MSIHQRDLDLRQVDEQVDFLREMYNPATQITVLSGDLDQDKINSLPIIRVVNTSIERSITEGTAGSHGSQDELNGLQMKIIWMFSRLRMSKAFCVG